MQHGSNRRTRGTQRWGRWRGRAAVWAGTAGVLLGAGAAAQPADAEGDAEARAQTVPTAAADDAGPDTPSEAEASDWPDFETMDEAVVRKLAARLWAQVAALRRRVAELESRVGAAGDGGRPLGDAAGGAGVSPGRDPGPVGSPALGSLGGPWPGAGPADADRGPWRITITANPEPQTLLVEQRLRQERDKLFGGEQWAGQSITDRLAEAEANLALVLSKGRYHSDNTDGYQTAERSEAEQRVRRLLTEKRASQRTIRRLQAELDALRSTRRVEGVTEDGRPVVIEAPGPAYGLGAALIVGQTYRVTGEGALTDAGGTITLRRAEPVR